jgi:hypothetical protein
MALIKCYECEKQISDRASACPHCGAPKEEQPPQIEEAEILIDEEGNLNLSHLTSSEGLKLPEHVGGSLNLSGLTTSDGLKLPEHVGGDIDCGRPQW